MGDKNYRMMKLLSCLIAVFILVVSQSSAAIVVSAGITGSGGSLEITDDLVFTMNQDAGNIGVLVFDEWVTSDNMQISVSASPAQSLAYERNGSPLSTSLTSLYDNFATTFNDVTPNDGFLTFSIFSASEGDTITIKAGTYTFTGNANFNSEAVGTYTGNIWLGSSPGVRYTDLISAAAVPEAASFPFIAALFSAGLFCLRRRRTAQAS